MRKQAPTGRQSARAESADREDYEASRRDRSSRRRDCTTCRPESWRTSAGEPQHVAEVNFLRTSRRSKRRSQKQPLQSTLNVGHPGNSPGHPSPAATPPASPRRRCVRGEKWKPSDNPVHAPAGENGRVAHGRAQRGWIGAWLAPLEPHASAASQGGAGTQRDPTLSAPGRVKQDGVCRRQHCR